MRRDTSAATLPISQRKAPLAELPRAALVTLYH
jgi:hypothetical protein